MELIQSAISEVEMSNREASHSAAESNYTGPVRLLPIPKFQSNRSSNNHCFQVMGRIVSNVVEMQNHIVQQFQGITTALESLKVCREGNRKTWLMS